MMEDIEINDDNYEYKEDVIQIFVSCCQNKLFELDENIIYPLYRLSYIYEVEDLISLIESYIAENEKKLVIKSILFKLQIIDKKTLEDKDLSSPIYNVKKDEDLLSMYIFDFIDNDEFLQLPLSAIYRILKNSPLNQDNLDEKCQKKIINFLYRCLDKFKGDASILFLDLDFKIIDDIAIDLISNLTNKYENIIDYNMINPKFLMNMTKDIYKNVFIYNQQRKQIDQLHEKEIFMCNSKINTLQNKENEYKNQIIQHQIEFKNQNEAIFELKNKINELQNVIQKQNNQIEEQQKQIHQMLQIGFEKLPNIDNDDIINQFVEQAYTISSQQHKIEEQQNKVEKKQRQIDRMKKIQKKDNIKKVRKQKGIFRKIMLKRKYQKHNEQRRKELLKEKYFRQSIDYITDDFVYLINDSIDENYCEEEEEEEKFIDDAFKEDEFVANDNDTVQMNKILIEQEKEIQLINQHINWLNDK